MIYGSCRQTSIGMMYVLERDKFIIGCGLGCPAEKTFFQKDTPLIAQTFHEINQYLNGNLKEFSIPFKLIGTPFQAAVWEVLRKIPYGKTLAYSDVANCINNPKASRAVGGACNKNPLLLIVPCHRVIGKNNDLVGFGYDIHLK
ncbi:MAG: methylated-DNA--[protein]-cysteine S-methyltransferase, partial [Candidatus Izemoplasmataceae bacterium]